MQVLDNLNNTLKSIKRNTDRLAQNARDYDIKNAIRLKQLQNKCGDFLKIDDYFDPDQTEFETIQTGEETMVQADVKNLLETFTDIKANEIDGLAGGLKGLPLAIVMCDRLKEYEKQLKGEEFHSKMQSTLLSGDFEEYKKQQQEKVNYIMKQEAIERKEFEQKLTPLKVRMLQMQQTLGVTDVNMAKENGIEFCKETKNGGCAPVLLTLDYVKNKEAQMLENARKNSNADTSQSQADREFIMLDYLREIATHMSFLNETMAMTAAILAEEKERVSGVTKGIDDFGSQLDERKKEFKEKVITIRMQSILVAMAKLSLISLDSLSFKFCKVSLMPNPKDFVEALKKYFKDDTPKATLLSQEKLNALKEKYNYDIIQDNQNLTSFYIKARGESTYDKFDINLTDYITNYARDESYESYTLRRIHSAIKERDNKNRRGDFRDTQREKEIAERDTRDTERKGEIAERDFRDSEAEQRARRAAALSAAMGERGLPREALEYLLKRSHIQDDRKPTIAQILKAYRVDTTQEPQTQSTLESRLDSKPHFAEYQRQEALKAYGAQNTESNSTQELDSTPAQSQNTPTKTYTPTKRRR